MPGFIPTRHHSDECSREAQLLKSRVPLTAPVVMESSIALPLSWPQLQQLNWPRTPKQCCSRTCWCQLPQQTVSPSAPHSKKVWQHNATLMPVNPPRTVSCMRVWKDVMIDLLWNTCKKRSPVFWGYHCLVPTLLSLDSLRLFCSSRKPPRHWEDGF